MPLTKKQKMKLGNLLADHRAVEDVADYLDSPTMQAVFKYVESLLERKYKQGRRDELAVEYDYGRPV